MTLTAADAPLVVSDAPWDTGLVWADADRDLVELPADERNRAVVQVLIELLDEGLIYFYEATDFGESYTRRVAESDGLSRDGAIGILSEGSRDGPRPGLHWSPWLVIRATQNGREPH